MKRGLVVAVLPIILMIANDVYGRSRAVTDSFRGMERVIKTQRARRDKLEKKRSALAAGATKAELILERYVELLDRDRKMLTELDAEIAQSNAILNELSLQQVELMEGTRNAAAMASVTSNRVDSGVVKEFSA